MIGEPRRVVVDPGVLVSGLIAPGGTTARLLDALLERRVVAVTSPRLLAELHTVLLRDRFRRYATREEVDRFVVRLRGRSDLVDDPAEVPRECRDPDDDYLIALARSAEDVAVIVSGDSDLLTVDLNDLSVVTPRALVDTLADNG